MSARGGSWARRLAVFALANLLALLALLAFAEDARGQGEVHAAASVATTPVEWGGEIDLQIRLKAVKQVEIPDRGWCWVVPTPDGDVVLSQEEFALRHRRAQQHVDDGGTLYHLFNITTPWGFLWVSIGFLGQALFTFRMLLQWLASEKEHRSVVPVGFWWGSLFGGVMLFAYFAWRKDVVGVLGQSTGVFVYLRNLVLIYRSRSSDARASTRPHVA